MSNEDPLMSVVQVARHFGVGNKTIATFVEQGLLPTLDRGRLVGEGRFDVPVIRLSWAEELAANTTPSPRLLDAGSDAVRLAVRVAIDFHGAVSDGDSLTIFELSSGQTRASAGGTVEAVAARWQQAVGSMMNPTTGVATGVFSLAPVAAVVLRVAHDAPAVPRLVNGPAPMLVATYLPLVPEAETWRVDYALWEQQAAIGAVLAQPVPTGPPTPGS